MGEFIVASRQYLDTLVVKRQGEVKLGEKVLTLEKENWEQELHDSTAKFAVLGIPEDIGVRANYGVGGTQTLWEPALKALLNIQHTQLMHGEDMIILGAFDFVNKMAESEKMSIEELREMVGFVDDTVRQLIEKIAKAGKIPIVIGGGHNNAYPILKGISKVIDGPLNCINLDAHSDFRAMEGRHSGNGFRYAHRGGYLEKYAVVGLHENYNAQDIIEELVDDPDLCFSYYEDIFIREKINFHKSVKMAVAHTAGRPTGIELDLDCIENTLSSAVTPSGISALHARQYVTWCGEMHPAYLHITEGAIQLQDGRQNMSTAKLVAYLISDFVKAYLKKKSFF